MLDLLGLLEQVDAVRLTAGGRISPLRKSEFGQFMTPAPVARFMASLFSTRSLHTARLLDAGAGVGSLTGAFLDRWSAGGFDFRRVEVNAHEIDDVLRDHLSSTLASYAAGLNIGVQIMSGDFIEGAVNQIQFGADSHFTHAILNPPYKKIGSHSRHRLLLRHVGIETVNLYSAFVALVVALMEAGGQVVAIIPRSFCNGPYYRPFREYLLARAAIRHIHLFASRDKAFKDDNVLQENIIILLERGGQQGEVVVSTSTDDSFADHAIHVYPFDQIVLPGDLERFIHVPASPERGAAGLSSSFNCSLAEIGVEVSTGPVVDFRLKTFVRDMPEPGSVPLLYPAHFSGQAMVWPKLGMKKPNAMMRNPETEKWLYPNGFYTVIRRFSSKEEKRRIMANLVCPDDFDAPLLGFENHLNVFHHRKQGLPKDLALGLSVFLNSTVVDECFRRFSGHTQVNATDLRLMKYPSREVLMELGRWAKNQGTLTQEQIDQGLENIP
ncbi:MAG: Eco57I restriction-modification methylase domain-containing protein [Sulfuricellaceae bacterium]|nr:Eco57I restriction-modification methylase domain-containing protein [Sulfuricellaceae bacterium]